MSRAFFCFAAPSEHCSEHGSLRGSTPKGWGSPARSSLWHFRGLQGLSHGAVALSHSGSECVWALLSPHPLTCLCGIPKHRAGDGSSLDPLLQGWPCCLLFHRHRYVDGGGGGALF